MDHDEGNRELRNRVSNTGIQQREVRAIYLRTGSREKPLQSGIGGWNTPRKVCRLKKNKGLLNTVAFLRNIFDRYMMDLAEEIGK